jgi:hypothetical protein
VSEQEHVQPAARSGVSISTTAKGAPTWKVYVAVGEDDEQLDRARAQAFRTYSELGRALTGAAPFTGEEPGA